VSDFDLLAALPGPFARRRLRAELAEILREESEALNAEQLVHRLFERRRRLSDLIVLSSASIRRKRRLKERIEALLGDGNAEIAAVDGGWRLVRSEPPEEDPPR
jgi:hypothetical protein